MSYLKLIDRVYPQTHSRFEALQVLERYRSELSSMEYETILNSLCSHALENFYLNERDILLSIAQLRNEITLDEIVALAKVS